MIFHIITFGCKVNLFESESVSQMMINKGHTLSNSYKDSNIVIFNSCTVTSKSEQKIFQSLRKVRRENPNCIIVLMGCIPQAFPGMFSSICGADVILGNSNRLEVAESISEFIKTRRQVTNIKPYGLKPRFENISTDKFSEHTRAFLKIEDGCNRFCSYCIIPYARGDIRSKPIEDVYSEAKRLSENGYKEIVLSGINLSSYGSDIGLTLCDAIDRVCEIDKIRRVRLGSLEPEMITDDVINRFIKQDKLCPQFHLSLQSGCDETLKRMRRRYSAKEYMSTVDKLREKINDTSITTDVMVGFPGESNDEFEKSLKFVSEVEFLKVHVFPYSKRPGTKAAEFPNQVSENEKKNRVKEMIRVTTDTTEKFLNQYIGKTQRILYERSCGNDVYEGYSSNYMLVRAKSREKLLDKIIDTKITDVNQGICYGTI